MLGYLIKHEKKGMAKKEHIKHGLNFEDVIFKEFKYYNKLIKDGRDVYTHALELHEFYNGIFFLTQERFISNLDSEISINLNFNSQRLI